MSPMTSVRWKLARIAILAPAITNSWIGHAAGKTIGLTASFIVRRAERQLLQALAELDERLPDDIGIDRLALHPIRRQTRTARRGALLRRTR